MKTLDIVRVENLALHGFHGVMEEEKTQGQRFFLDISCQLDTRGYSRDDNYKNALCYGSLIHAAKEVSKETRFNLIESFADNIIRRILSTYTQVEEATVTIRKPSAPIDAIIDTVSVTITRTRDDL